MKYIATCEHTRKVNINEKTREIEKENKYWKNQKKQSGQRNKTKELKLMETKKWKIKTSSLRFPTNFFEEC